MQNVKNAGMSARDMNFRCLPYCRPECMLYFKKVRKALLVCGYILSILTCFMWNESKPLASGKMQDVDTLVCKKMPEGRKRL